MKAEVPGRIIVRIDINGIQIPGDGPVEVSTPGGPSAPALLIDTTHYLKIDPTHYLFIN